MNAKDKVYHRIQSIVRALPEIPLPLKEYIGKNWPADKAALLVQIVKQVDDGKMYAILQKEESAQSAASLSLYWDWAFVEFAFEAAKDNFYRTKKQLRTKWNNMRQVEVRSFREDISERNRRMFMNDRREVNRINAERHITGGGPPPTQDVDLVDPDIFEDPGARMRAKMGLMDFPSIFVPPPDNPPIAPAAAANILAGFSQYSDKEFSVLVPVTTLDETPLNLTAVGGYDEGGSAGYQAGGSGGYEAGGSGTSASAAGFRTSASARGSGTSASAGGSGTSASAGGSGTSVIAGGSGTSASARGSGTSASAGPSRSSSGSKAGGSSIEGDMVGPSSAKRAKRTGTNPELSELYVTRDKLVNAQIRALDLENERQAILNGQQVKESETRTKLYETLIAAIEVFSIHFYLENTINIKRCFRGLKKIM